MTHRPFSIRRLGADDIEPFSRLRLRALREEPRSFSSSPQDHETLSPGEVAQRLTPSADALVLGAFDDSGALVGIAGVVRERPIKHAHKAFLWGVYVAPEARRRGIAESLVRAAIDAARSSLRGVRTLNTSVFLSAPGARDLYLRCGFVSWGIEPCAAMVDDQCIDEEQLRLELHTTGPGDRRA